MCESKFPVATPSVNHRYLFVPRLKRPVGLENQQRSAEPSPVLAQPDPNTTKKQTQAKQIKSTPVQ